MEENVIKVDLPSKPSVRYTHESLIVVTKTFAKDEWMNEAAREEIKEGLILETEELFNKYCDENPKIAKKLSLGIFVPELTVTEEGSKAILIVRTYILRKRSKPKK